VNELRFFIDETLLPSLSIEVAYSWPGHNFTAAGDRLRGSCPFHQSKTGSSFVVTPSNGLWWCQGCTRGGDVILYRHLLSGGNGAGPRGSVFVDLVRALCVEAGIAFPECKLTPEEKKRAEAASRNRAELEVLYLTAAQRLWTSEGDDARAYLISRGLTETTIREYGLGLAGNEVREADRGYILQPWRDERGRPLTYYGRWPGDPPPVRSKTTAMPGEGTKRAPIYLDRVRGSEVVIVEGFFDVLVLRQAGDDRIVSGIAGTLPQAAIECLARRGVTTAFICGDPDQGGRNGNESNVRRLHASGIETCVLEELPDGQDPDEYVLAHGIDEWRQRVQKAISGWTWIGLRSIGDVTPESGDAVKNTAVRKTLKALEDAPAADRDAVIRALAKATGRTVSSLRRDAPQAKRKGKQSAPASAPGSKRGSQDSQELTDTGNSERFAARFADRIRYVPEFGEYLVFEDARLVLDVGGVRTLEMTREITRQMRLSSDMRIAGFGVKSEKRAARENMRALAKSLPGLTVSPSALDADPWLLSCPNGLVDLRTGTIRPSRLEDLVTKRTGVPYNVAALAPRWRRFIFEVTCGDAETEAFLQRAVGYSLTGTTGEQVFFFLYGEGANGKGTFVKLLQRALGDYAATLRTESLMSSYGQAHPTELVPLFGARFVTANEVPDGRGWNEARLKELTGEDRLTARRMHENFWTFEPTHKLWISGNYRPRVHGDDFGLWRRVRLIPFEARFDVNPHLFEELLVELPGVLAWAVQGCLAWQREGLGLPERVREATAAYRERENIVGQFVDEACYRHPQAETTTAVLYAAFEEWCDRAGERPAAKRGFSERLERLGFRRNENAHSRGFFGIGLTAEWSGRVERGPK
jgi:putative DNA primase/helicase